MNYLLLGEDLAVKDARLSQIKSKLFKTADAAHFDYESLDAVGLPADALKKALLTLPVTGAKRLVLVRNVHKLKAADAAVLMGFLRTPSEGVDVVLDSPEKGLKGELKDAAKWCTVTAAARPEAGNVFDMARLMAAGRARDALDLLHTLYADGSHPLQIMGGLVWYWGKEGRSLGKARFEQGLKALEDADLNIKRSRLDPEYAVEKVVVELTGLLRR